ncbi:PhoX family protein [Aquimarina algicola]|uniref:DUF839 domain-containing protein n=1 Tax=Aquimarina algicola TaxID=2589995 RepID=A0A504JDA5_9FLAO|nr:hypothetical protein [Aquimarina algicola]TPN88694.1 hypothetical protein FHK87_00330 [Aquimarina algicola]
MKNYFLAAAMSSVVMLSSCDIDDYTGNPTPPGKGIELKNHSVTPSFIKDLTSSQKLKAYSLFGSADVLPDTPDFIFGGTADGAGLLRNKEGGFTYVVNNENHFAVARIKFDRTFKPVAGDYIYNSDGSDGTRLCSASLAVPRIHGFGPLFLTAGESGEESLISGISPFADASANNTPRFLPALGRASFENAMPLPAKAFRKRTVIIMGEDDTSSGRITMYDARLGDLQNGKVYALVVKDENGNPITEENKLPEGQEFDIEFKEIENAKNITGADTELIADNLFAMPFKRVEDLDYQKGRGNERTIFFNVTGSASSTNPNGTKQGRTYKLELNSENKFVGKLTCVIDGDNPNGVIAGRDLQSPDNITATENYLYIKEDPNGGINLSHYSYIWQYNIATKELKPVVELDVESGIGVPNDPYGRTDASFRSWEYGAMIDVSDVIGVPDTFMVCIQTHTWREDRFIGVDGGSLSTDNQGSQVVLIKGLPR